MRILISPNAFKNSLDAHAAALAIESGLQQSRLRFTSECFPIGDGGDGTAELLIKKQGGIFVDTLVHDALGRIISSSFGLIEEGQTAVIELANASGIRLLRPEELNPLLATSFGTGEQIKTALDRGVRKIIIGMGGSATVDAGIGILKALGIRFLDKEELPISPLPKDLARLSRIDISGIDERILACELIVLCDVANFLLGDEGAVPVFAPQKGATAADMLCLNKGLSRFSEIVYQTNGKNIGQMKHGGTAGGAAAGLFALLNAQLVDGIDYFLQATDFEKSLAKADLLITGEGSIDNQTLQGKAPFGVAALAKRQSLPVIALSGNVPLSPSTALQYYFDALIPLSHAPLDLSEALGCTKQNLIRTATMLGNLLALSR